MTDNESPLLSRLRAWVGALKNPARKRLLEFYCQFVDKGDLCFDVGANRGTMTELLVRLGAKAVSLEPQTLCFEVLKEKFALNESVTLLRSAVSDQVGDSDLAVCDADEMSSMNPKFVEHYVIELPFRWDHVEKVPTTTLDALIVEFGLPDFCVLDIEGHEAQVLHGLTQAIPRIRFEFHQALPGVSSSCVRRLIDLGDYRFRYSTNEQEGFDIDRWVSPEEIVVHIERAPKNGHIYAVLASLIDLSR